MLALCVRQIIGERRLELQPRDRLDLYEGSGVDSILLRQLEVSEGGLDSIEARSVGASLRVVVNTILWLEYVILLIHVLPLFIAQVHRIDRSDVLHEVRHIRGVGAECPRGLGMGMSKAHTTTEGQVAAYVVAEVSTSRVALEVRLH